MTLEWNNWKIEKGSKGLIITKESHGRHIMSFPQIRKWYHQPLWPWVIYKSLKEINGLDK